jgi:hypothetical protein
MYDEFADWIREIDASPTAEKLQTLWDIIETLGNRTWKSQEILDLVRFALALPGDTRPIESTLTTQIREQDPTFSVKNNQHALRTVASTALIYLLREKNKLWILAALAATCGSWQRELNVDVQESLVRTAARMATERAAQQREGAIGNTPNFSLNAVNKALTDFKGIQFEPVSPNQAQLAQQNMQRLSAGLLTVIQEVQKVLNAANKIYAQQHQALLALSEESDMLWWVFSEYSRGLGKPTLEIGKEAWNLQAAWELAELTYMLPAPESVKAVLSKSLILRDKKGNKTALTLSLAGCNREWRQRVRDAVPADELGNITPVLQALDASLRVSEGEDWQAIYRTAVGLDAGTQVARLDLAWQLYQELLLARAYQDV